MTFNHIQKFKDAFTKYYNGLMYKIKDLGNGNYEYYIPTGDSEELIGSYVNGIYWLKDQLTFAEHDASNPTSTGGIHDMRYVSPDFQIKIDGTWTTVTGGGGSGTVTSVAISGNDGLEVDSGSPITSSGTIALGVNKTTLLSHINVEDGAEVNNISDVNATDLTDGGATTLHKHSYNNLDDKPSIPSALADLSDDTTHRIVTDTEKSTWNGKQDALTEGTDYLNPTNLDLAYEPLKGSDDNYVTDAEKIVIGNTSNTNTGDQDISGIATNAGDIDNIEAKTDFISVTQAVDLDTMESNISTNNAKVSNVSTSLSIGTKTATTMGITSDGGVDDVVLPEADTDEAGLLGADKWDEIVANTAKVTNATHSGDVSGDGVLTIGAGKVTEAMQVLADNTTNNVSTSKHGYAPKGDGSTTKYLNANGAYSIPAGGGGTPTNIVVESPTMETSPTTGGCYLWSEDDSEWQQSQKGIGIYDGTDIVLKGQCTLSGLTAGLNYYADSSGDISATSSDYKVGLAISSTILIVDTAGDWGTAWSMPSGLTHYWPLATDGNDDVGTAHLTATSITYSGGWAIFNGSSSNYSIPSAGVAPVNSDWTEEIWIYADTLDDDRIVSVGDGSTLQRSSNVTASAITFTYRGADSANHVVTSTTTPSTSTVYQVIITHDYGTNTKLYINGSLEDTDTYTGNDAGQFNIGNYIGSQSGSSFYFDGKMRKRRIWTSVLTASEVSAMYNGGAGR